MREQAGVQDGNAARGGPGGGRTTLAAVAALGSVLAASSCCLPVAPFLMAAGLAGGSAFLSAARPYLLAASIVFLGYGFYQAGRARKCKQRPKAVHTVLLWVSAVLVVVSLFFPQVMANVAADLLAR